MLLQLLFVLWLLLQLCRLLLVPISYACTVQSMIWPYVLYFFTERKGCFYRELKTYEYHQKQVERLSCALSKKGPAKTDVSFSSGTE